MTEERTFKNIIIEALNFHNRTIRDYNSKVVHWKERFEQIQLQKHKYQEECKNTKKELENYIQENNKSKGEIDSLRQIVNREHRSEKCAACSSFQHTIQTLKDVYENTLTQKDSHIAYLENRIKELERNKYDRKNHNVNDTADPSLFSPDSTCKYTPKQSSSKGSGSDERATKTNQKLRPHEEEEDGLFDPSPDKIDKSQKLRLPPNKKRSRYSEDPSPEMKRLRFDNVNTTIELSQDHGCSEHNTEIVRDKEPRTIVPETCDFDMDLMENEEDETCLGIDEKEETKIGVPGFVKKNIRSKMHESDHRKSARLVTVDNSSSSENEEGNIRSEVKNQKAKEVNRSWLHSILKSPDCNIETRKCEDVKRTAHGKNIRLNRYDAANGKKAKKGHNSTCSQSNDLESRNCGKSQSENVKVTTLKKTQSDPGYLLQQSSTISKSNQTVEDLSHDMLLQVVPITNGKIVERKKASRKHDSNETRSQSSTNDSKEQSVSLHSKPSLVSKSPSLIGDRPNTTNDSDEQSISTHSKPNSMLKSPSLIVGRPNKPRCSGLTSEQPIDIPSDNESPLILRTSGKVNDQKSNYPEVDKLFEDSDESPTAKTKTAEVSKLSRKIRGRKSRSQDVMASPVLRDRSKLKSVKTSLIEINDNDQDTENRLKQTTLSQAFLNSTRQDSDLQQAIEQSLREASKGSIEDQDLIESKENSPPFKKPTVPKIKTRKNKNDLNESLAFEHKSKHFSDFDMDETVAPSRMTCEAKKGNCEYERVNGSLDPAIQLSQLCGESQDLEDDIEAPVKNRKADVNTSHDHIDTLLDFRLEDLHGDSDMPRTSTCVELDDDSQGIPCSSTSVKFGSGRLKQNKRKLRTGDNEEKEKETDTHRQIMEDSFDVRPKKAETEYAYVNVVRGKEERRKLKAYWCQECVDYYKDTGMSDEDMQKKMQRCSRHRAEHVPPSTPEHFWSIGFMDTPECEERGYINKETSEDKQKPVFKRKHGYKQLFKSKKDQGS